MIVFSTVLFFIYSRSALGDELHNSPRSPSPVKVFVSDNAGARLEEQPQRLQWVGAGSTSSKALVLDPAKLFQTFDGVGGSFARAGALVLNSMPEDTQEKILKDLFDPIEGAGFFLGKIPIAATDFGVPEWYTYADKEQAENLPFFSLEHDLDPKEGFIPFVQRAQEAAGRTLRLEATMDYPPNWMLDPSTPLPHADLNTSHLDALATYYDKYWKALHARGVHVEFLSLFNELTDSYMNASYENTRKLLVQHVAPLFKHSPDAPKLTWTEKFGRRITQESSPSFYEMMGVQESTDVIFYHGYDCNYGPAEGMGWQCDGLNTTCPFLEDSAQQMRNFYETYGRNRTLWMTEVCYASEFTDYQVSNGCPALPRLDFQDSMQWGRMLMADFNIVQASGWIYWNFILDKTGGPWLVSPEHNDPDPNEQQPIVVADPSSGEYFLTGCYFAMAHFGKYIPVGSKRMSLYSGDDVSSQVSAVAFFEEKIKEVTIVLMNDDLVEYTLDIVIGNYATTVLLTPISFTTLKFNTSVN